jgi:hypothetical protein
MGRNERACWLIIVRWTQLIAGHQRNSNWHRCPLRAQPDSFSSTSKKIQYCTTLIIRDITKHQQCRLSGAMHHKAQRALHLAHITLGESQNHWVPILFFLVTQTPATLCWVALWEPCQYTATGSTTASCDARPRNRPHTLSLSLSLSLSTCVCVRQ